MGCGAGQEVLSVSVIVCSQREEQREYHVLKACFMKVCVVWTGMGPQIYGLADATGASGGKAVRCLPV